HKPRCLHPTMDPDRPAREALESDVRALLNDLQARVDAVVITGDIAFEADSEEYQVAGEWLDKIAQLVGCPQANVFTVPGNHDVDRNVVKQVLVKAVRTPIQMEEPKRKSDRLLEVMNDESAGEALMRPLQSYNQFA